MAVALDNGLIVPVIRRADERTWTDPRHQRSGGACAVEEAEPRRRAAGNIHHHQPRRLGALYGLPLINLPVAILDVV